MKNINRVSFFIIMCIQIPTFMLAQHIAGGAGHSLLVCNSGSVQAWGDNGTGQLGDGTTVSSFTPVAVSNLSGIIAVAAGLNHSLALRNDSSVWAWGGNTFGQLGIGNNTYSPIPVQVTSLSGIVAVSCGVQQSLALKSDGTLYAWGNNANGELGNGTNTDSNVPVQITGLTGIIAIAGGNNHFIALRNDSSLWAWGNNFFGELGTGTNAASNFPVHVSNIDSVIKISGGSNHSIVLKSDGTVWAWGYNYAGQLGNGGTTDSNVPVLVNISTGIIAIAGGGNFSLALKTDSTVWSWGDNLYSQLGNGTAVGYSAVPVKVTNLQGVIEIDGSFAHSMALKMDGSTWTWGYNSNGQLGNGNTINSNIPVNVSGACSSVNTSVLTNENPGEQVKIYPGISDGKFILIMQKNKNERSLLYIYNSSGQLIFSQNLNEGGNSIDLKNKADGMYFSEVINNGKIIFKQKVIKQTIK